MARKRKKIQKIKRKLEAGKFSPAQAEQKREAIREMGGKVRQDLGEPQLAPPLTEQPQPQAPAPQPGGDFQLSGPLQYGYQPPEMSPGLINKARLGKPGSLYKADVAAELDESMKQIALQNPNQFNPFGSQTVTFDEQGRPVVTQALSPEQQALYEAETGISQTGRDLALQQLQGGGFGQAFAPELTERQTTGDLAADRQRIEEDVFARLTRDLEEDRAKAIENTERTLYNRGIPLDPANPQYQKAMEQVNQRFDEQSQAARQTATQMGGQEFSRAFGIQEQLRAGELGEQLGIRGQQFGEIGALTGLGPGLRAPQFQGFQGPQYDVADPSQLFFGAKELQLAKRGQKQAGQQFGQELGLAYEQLALDREKLARAGAPAGPALPPSPFQ